MDGLDAEMLANEGEIGRVAKKGDSLVVVVDHHCSTFVPALV